MRRLLEVQARADQLPKAGQKHIDHLEAKAEKAVADFRNVEAEFGEYRAPWLVRAADKASKALRKFRLRPGG